MKAKQSAEDILDTIRIEIHFQNNEFPRFIINASEAQKALYEELIARLPKKWEKPKAPAVERQYGDVMLGYNQAIEQVTQVLQTFFNQEGE